MRKKGKSYTLGHLLARQPKRLQKDPHYPLMLNHYNLSEPLRSLRISRRCYTLLNKATILPENLKYFYRTYRLPRDPFFPLFLKIKSQDLLDQQKKREEKERYIMKKMQSLPPNIRRYIRYLAEYEGEKNRAHRYPVWEEHLFPATKKKVHVFCKYNEIQWIDFFRTYLIKLEKRYRTIDFKMTEELLACCILQTTPGHLDLTANFRTLSKEYHPDRGGNSDLFIQLKWAEEILKE